MKIYQILIYFYLKYVFWFFESESNNWEFKKMENLVKWKYVKKIWKKKTVNGILYSFSVWKIIF